MHMTLPTLMLVLGAKTSAKYALMRPPTEWPTIMTSARGGGGRVRRGERSTCACDCQRDVSRLILHVCVLSLYLSLYRKTFLV